ncbi:endonuclease III, partial [Candidatus Micrarchaeota archaeon CG10_big_fil_rev_8_21_14_0_10_45_29]
MQLVKFYKKLLLLHGRQGWWPLLGVKGENPTKTGSMRGYHPGDYSYPKNQEQKFEICIGAILAQNTNWVNVEKALLNLQKAGALGAKKVLQIKKEKLAKLVRPAGYFNQKARKLKEFAKFYLKCGEGVPTREELLGIWGVGPETADSILLYAYKLPFFVVDAYTKRIFAKEKFFKENEKYEKIRQMCEEKLPKDYKLLQEFHALIV